LALAQRAWADDWAVTRSPFDKRIVARYKALLGRSPNDGYALGKLLGIYKRHSSVAALVREYQTACQRYPKSFTNQVVLGHLYRRAGQIDRAIAQYERAAVLSPAAPSVPAALGALYSKQKKDTQAIAAYQRALALAKNARLKQRYLRALATIALSNRDLKAAREYYGKLVQLAPKNGMLRIEYAQALARSGHEELAIAQYRTLLKHTSDSAMRADLLKEIGALLNKKGKDGEAIETYRKAMSLTAEGHWLRRDLTARIIEIYRRKGQLKQLIAHYEKTWKKRDHFRWDTLGKLYDQVGDESRAKQAYLAALKTNASSIDTRVRLISLLERAGETKAAIAEYQKLAKLAPGEPRYGIELAKRLFDAGQQKAAIQSLEQLGRRFPSDVSVHAILADLFSRWGEEKLAMREAQILVKIEPRDPGHVVSLGEQFFVRGQKKKAIETWQRLLRIVPQKHAAFARLAEVYAQHEMYEQAVEFYRKAVKVKPKHLPYLRSLALTLESARNTQEALAQWQLVLKLVTGTSDRQSQKEARRHVIGILHRTYRLRQAMAEYEKLFYRQPPDVEAGYFLAEANLTNRNPGQAEAIYRKIIEYRPKSVDAHLALERVYRRQRKLALAVDVLKRLVELDPKSARQYCPAPQLSAGPGRQATQVLVLSAQRGVAPKQCASLVQARELGWPGGSLRYDTPTSTHIPDLAAGGRTEE
jgi:tetratricopeptide (TPR) repeat protein